MWFLLLLTIFHSFSSSATQLTTFNKFLWYFFCRFLLLLFVKVFKKLIFHIHLTVINIIFTVITKFNYFQTNYHHYISSSSSSPPASYICLLTSGAGEVLKLWCSIKTSGSFILLFKCLFLLRNCFVFCR